MSKSNSVSLHIRRGDYLSKSVEVFEPLNLDYYYSGIEYFNNTIKEPHYFVFSDDIEWAKSNFVQSSSYTVVDYNGADKGYEDMRLMSLCKHNIIANSSFSWWGAWLNRNPDKNVLAPKKWFSSKTSNLNSNDLLPSSWIKI